MRDAKTFGRDQAAQNLISMFGLMSKRMCRQISRFLHKTNSFYYDASNAENKEYLLALIKKDAEMYLMTVDWPSKVVSHARNVITTRYRAHLFNKVK